MEEILPALLNKVWTEFRRAGIPDDVRIIEHIAAFLLESQGKDLTDDLPRKPIPNKDFDETAVRMWLEDAQVLAGSAGELLDRYVLFRQSEMRAGGQYITPRHIVRFMAALVETQDKNIADFACGTAGFLVHSLGKTLTGIEISPELARIARANLSLNERNGTIHNGNSLRLVTPSQKYECLLMNPPFGEKVRSDYGTRSETALNTLALECLSEQGRAALLAPSGLLFSGSKNEYKLRQRLVNEFHLEAVITLPDDSFQPYSVLPTHLFLVQRVQPNKNASTWFMRPVFDGYISGRGRNLTEPPKTPNDLTLVQAAISASRETTQAKGDTLFTLQPLLNEGAIFGMLVNSLKNVVLVSVRSLPEVRDRKGNLQDPSLLILESQQGAKRQFWQLPFEIDVNLQEVQNLDELIRSKLGLNKKALW